MTTTTAASALLAAFNRAPAQALPKAAQAILELPGVESLEREGADWCCHLRFGWTTEALGGGGTIIDSNLQTIRAYVRGAYALPPAPAPTACASEPLGGYQHGGGFIPCDPVAPAAPAPDETSEAVILQDFALPILSFKPGRLDGPYVAGDGIELWSFSSEAAALRYCQALRREGAVPVALAENDLGQWRPILPGEAVAPAVPAPAGPAPELPAFVTHQQQQQQPQQAPAAALSPRAARAVWGAASEAVRSGDATPALLETVAAEITGQPPAAPAPVVASGPRARTTAPLGMPQAAADLLDRFNLRIDGLLTAGASSPKLSKGGKIAQSVILHHLPARSLAAAVYGTEATTAPRSRLEGLAALAEANGIGSLVSSHNGCPWASKGCSAGCLAWAGHGGISTTVAAARARRTMAYVRGHGPYALAVLWAIGRAYAAAQRKGQPLAYRLRGTDDLPWHALRFNLSPAEAAVFARRFGLPVVPGIGTTISEALQLAAPGTLQPYEYSAAPLRGPLGLLAQRAAGIDTTCSLKADRPGGCADAAEAVAAGFRVAVPVAISKGQPLPPVLMLRPSADGPILRLLTVDGDLSDHRWLDPQGPQPGGFDGVAVLLRTKVSRGRGPAAADFSLSPQAGLWQPLTGGGHAALSHTTWID
jgi:hypothetical protein